MKCTYLLLVALLGCNVVGCNSVSSALCKDDVQTASASPRGNFIASVKLRDCGATTDFSSVISIKDVGGSSQISEEDVFVLRGDNAISIKWIDDNTLKVECEECDPKNIFKKLESWNRVEIRY